MASRHARGFKASRVALSAIVLTMIAAFVATPIPPASAVPPTANAGPDQIVTEGTIATLDGTASSDPESGSLTYSWQQIDGTGMSLNDPSSPTPIFAVADVGVRETLIFELTVTDNEAFIDTDTVSITINQPPTADAGPDQTVDETDPSVTLSGSAGDSDGTTASFQWEQLSGPPVTIADPSSPTTTFTPPPLPSADATLTFRFTVIDNDGGTDTDDITITIQNVVQPPTANAGPDQTVNGGSNVALNGTASTDPENGPLSYSWQQTDGTPVTLTGATTATPSFTAPPAATTEETLTFELEVTDGEGGSDVDTVDITVSPNPPPVANAGPDQTVNENAPVSLDGTASTDPDGGPLTYSWQQTDGTPVTLTGATTATPSFTAPTVPSAGDTLTFELTVTDSGGASDTNEVDITVNNVNVPPVANAGPDQTVNEGDSVGLNGLASTDPDGTIESYLWTQTAGVPAVLVNPDMAEPLFTAPAVPPGGSVLTFQLTVIDNDGGTDTDTVDITVNNVNQPPTANAGPDQTVGENVLVTLSGSATDDADGVSYQWIQTAGPAVVLSSATAQAPTFMTPFLSADAALVFELTATDVEGLSDTDTVQINIDAMANPPTANAGQDRIVNMGSLVMLNGTASTDPENAIMSYRWIQTAGNITVTLANANSAISSFTAPSVNASQTLTFELLVTDNEGVFDTDTIAITISPMPINQPPTANAQANPDTIREGGTVQLDGSGSTDPDDPTLSYFWEQISGRGGDIEDPFAAQTSFVAPAIRSEEDTVVIRLTVTDDGGATSSDTVEITIRNRSGGGGGGGGGGFVSSPNPSTSTNPPVYSPAYFQTYPLAKMQILGASFVNGQNVKVNQIPVGSPVAISAEFKNYQQLPQDYVLIVQVVDGNGFTVDIGWQKGLAEPSLALTQSRLLLAEEEGTYTAKVFVWDTPTNVPTPLSEPQIMILKVVGK